jgi:phage terminase large subunit-like protein
VRDACKRHLRDLKEGPERGLFFDTKEVDETIAFFREILRLNGGEFEGKAFELSGWQIFIVGSIFGWKRRTVIVGSGSVTWRQRRAAGNRRLPPA